MTVKVVGDGEYTVLSHEKINNDGISMRIMCMTIDLLVMLRQSDGNNRYLPDDNLGLDPTFFEKDNQNNRVLKILIMTYVVHTVGLHGVLNIKTFTENIECLLPILVKVLR